MLTLLLLTLFCLILFFYGWQLTKLILAENKIEVLLPLSMTIGIGSYLFLLNLSSYLIPIQFNFYISLGFLLLVGLVLYFVNSKSKLKIEWGLSKKEIIIILVTLIMIMSLSGLILFRNLENDELASYHLPLAALFAGGNFPPLQSNMPTEIVGYHHGPDLLIGAIFKLTHLPIWYGHDFLGFILSGAFFLILFLIARLLIKNNIKAYFVAVVTFFAGGLNFIYGFQGVITLFKKFILNYNIPHPYKFVSLIWEGGIALGGPVVKYFQFLWGPISWALFITLIYLILILIIKGGRPPKRLLMLMLISILLSAHTLGNELVSVAVCLGLLIYPFIFYLITRNKFRFKVLLVNFVVILCMTSLLIIIQGGTFPTILKNLLAGQTSYGQPVELTMFKYPFAFDDESVVIPFYSKYFITNFGLLYLFIIPAIIYFFRKRLQQPLFLAVISWSALLIPFVISFNSIWQGTMSRFFSAVNFIWALIIVIWLLELLAKFNKTKIIKFIIIVCLVIIPLDGLFFLFSRPLYPLRANGADKHSFSGKLTAPSTIEQKAYDWVKKNTTIQDYFLAFEKVENLGAANIQNYKFIIYTQRFAPIYSNINNPFYNLYLDTSNPLTLFHQLLITSCQPVLVHQLNYKYLFVDNKWPAGLEEQCLAKNQLELKFNQQEGDRFVRIYFVK